MVSLILMIGCFGPVKQFILIISAVFRGSCPKISPEEAAWYSKEQVSLVNYRNLELKSVGIRNICITE